MNITTTYKNVNGTPKVVATAAGRQKTVNWDLSKSTDWNHGTAAGALIIAMHKRDPLTTNPPRAFVRSMDNVGAEHTSNDAGTVHRFDV
jgi:hypothetical protein